MPHKVKSRVLETSTTNGTTNYVVAGAITGATTFAARYSIGDTLPYAAWEVDANGQANGAWEVGIGQYSALNTITRTSVSESSNADAPVNWTGSTTKYVAVALSPDYSVWMDNNKAIPQAPTLSETAQAAATYVNWLVMTRANKSFPAVIDADNRAMMLQPHIGMSSAVWWKAAIASTTVSPGGLVLTATGTATASAAWAITNAYTRANKLEYLVTTAATTAVAGYRGSGLKAVRGNAAGVGGIFHFARVGAATGATTGTRRFFAGIASSTAAPTDVQPSSLLNIVGVGYDAADTTWQVMFNDGTGAATKVNTGISRPAADRTNLVDIYIYCAPNGSTYYVTFYDHASGTTFSTSNSADIPANTTAMNVWGYSSVGGTSSVTGIAVSTLYLESGEFV